MLEPDNSGVVTAGNYAVYAHRVINNTGAAETFDLYADSSRAIGDPCTPSPGWCVAFHWDANGDGVYTPGTDQQIANTQQLAQGASQLVFVVVNAPSDATANMLDVTHLTARSRTDPDVFDGATDTTTVVSARSHDLAGGGTRVANPGDVANHPGTIVNLNPTTADRFELAITAASLYGLDGLNHPTALHIDNNGDGVISGSPPRTRRSPSTRTATASGTRSTPRTTWRHRRQPAHTRRRRWRPGRRSPTSCAGRWTTTRRSRATS